MRGKILLFLIVLLAGGLRLVGLGQNPPALSWDEAAWGYNAYVLGLIGKDEFGRSWPLDYLESFGDFKPPVYAYLTILPVKIFGLNEFAARFASAFLGMLTVLLTYFLVREILWEQKLKEKVALVASFLLAISPWHVLLSRGAFEANVASFFIVAGVTFFLSGARARGWQLILAAIAFALSLMTFNTARLVSPILVGVLSLVCWKKLKQKKGEVFLAILVGLAISWPTIRFLMAPQAKLRYQEVNIFSDPQVVLTANQQMANDKRQWWSKIIHNRRWGYTLSLARHYLDHFNPSFLFVKGDGNPKLAIGDVGQMYLWELPFLVIGVLWWLKTKPGYWWLVPFWLLVGVLPSALTRETPHALRIETTLPTWQILTAYGLVVAMARLKKRWICLLALVVTINFGYFIHGYWRHYPIEAAREWEYAYRPMYEYLFSVEKQYDQIWFSDVLGRPYIFYLFYTQLDPKKFRQDSLVERETLGFVNVWRVGKYRFFKGGLSPMKIKEGSVIVCWFDQVPSNVKILKEIFLPNGQKTLVAYEF